MERKKKRKILKNKIYVDSQASSPVRKWRKIKQKRKSQSPSFSGGTKVQKFREGGEGLNLSPGDRRDGWGRVREGGREGPKKWHPRGMGRGRASIAEYLGRREDVEVVGGEAVGAVLVLILVLVLWLGGEEGLEGGLGLGLGENFCSIHFSAHFGG